MNLPIEFVSRTKSLLGEEEYNVFEKALIGNSPTSIRLNNKKYKFSVHKRNVLWSDDGSYLESRPQFTFDPLFHAGCYYVQEASSMFVERALSAYVNKPVIMLDLCAAPGGKSTNIRSKLPEGSLLVSNEIMRNRVQILSENMIKWGDANVIVTNNDSLDFSSFNNMFDAILADVPCSGEGMFRKDDVAIKEWSMSNVDLCHSRQREIIGNIWPTLKDNGILIYSTCTFNREENEDNVNWIIKELGAEALPIDTEKKWNITGDITGGNLPVYRFLPHKTEGEGFFMAVLRKKSDDESSQNDTDCFETFQNDKIERLKKKTKDKSSPKSSVITEDVKNWITNHEEYRFESLGDRVFAFPNMYATTLDILRKKLRIIHAGIEMGMNKGKDFIPSHTLAMSTNLDISKFTVVDLDYYDAISYLRKEAVVIDAQYPKGYVLFTYKNVPLGFSKNIGNRTNNLYPAEWKIRSGYVPGEPVSVLD